MKLKSNNYRFLASSSYIFAYLLFMSIFSWLNQEVFELYRAWKKVSDMFLVAVLFEIY